MKIPVVCINSLHEFSLDEGATGVECPVCGCKYVRRVPVKGVNVEVVVEPGKHAIPVKSWLADKGEFVKLAREAYPEASEEQIAEMVERQHGHEA